MRRPSLWKRTSPRRIILRAMLSPGDIVMLTAAVRDLHHCYPERFLTDVRTSVSALWENNPYLTPLSEDDSSVEIVDCNYPLIHRSNQEPWHFIHGYIHDLNLRYGLQIRPTSTAGDIHVSALEKSWIPQVEEILGERREYWIIAAGGKYDFTAKWWEPAKWQRVVDRFRDEILFVQVGERDHWHPELSGVLDLRGRTDTRQLVRLMYHAAGVCCVVTFLMHLAAAVPAPDDWPRPCVVVAGGREPPQWEAYPTHQFLHTVGALDCCRNGGCWKSRTVALNDGSPLDAPGHLCERPVVREGSIAQPQCLDMISADDVIRRIEWYLEGRALAAAAKASRVHDRDRREPSHVAGQAAP